MSDSALPVKRKPGRPPKAKDAPVSTTPTTQSTTKVSTGVSASTPQKRKEPEPTVPFHKIIVELPDFNTVQLQEPEEEGQSTEKPTVAESVESGNEE